MVDSSTLMMKIKSEKDIISNKNCWLSNYFVTLAADMGQKEDKEKTRREILS